MTYTPPTSTSPSTPASTLTPATPTGTSVPMIPLTPATPTGGATTPSSGSGGTITPTNPSTAVVGAYKWELGAFTYVPDDVLNILYNGLFEMCHWYEVQEAEGKRLVTTKKPITINTATVIRDQYWLDPYKASSVTMDYLLDNTIDDYAESFARRFIRTWTRYKKRV